MHASNILILNVTLLLVAWCNFLGTRCTSDR